MGPCLVSVRRGAGYWVATLYERDGERMRASVRIEGPAAFVEQAARTPELFALLADTRRR